VRELLLFAGAGLGAIGTHHLLGWDAVGYVEINDYCQRVLRARIDDGLLSDAPIFGDIKAFIRDGYAASYTGLVDVVSGGFPCQPFSVAGNQLGADDERNMWTSTIEAIRIIRPRYVFLENVPGLLVHEYFGTILGDLAESGFDAEWACFPAGRLGAHHRRIRLFIRACRPDAGGVRSQRERSSTQEPWSREQFEGLVQAALRVSVPAGSSGGISDGCASRMDRIKALGNGQIPRVVAAAWRLLNG